MALGSEVSPSKYKPFSLGVLAQRPKCHSKTHILRLTEIIWSWLPRQSNKENVDLVRDVWLRTSTGQVRGVDPGLAARLASVIQALEAINASISAPGTAASPLCAGEEGKDVDLFSPLKEQQRLLLREYQQVIQEIQALLGFEIFMNPIPFRTLQNAIPNGSVIIINYRRWRCDILIVLHDARRTRAHTGEITALKSRLLFIRRACTVPSKQSRKELRSVLDGLHELVGQLVIEELR
jgi:hypothetical protein